MSDTENGSPAPSVGKKSDSGESRRSKSASCSRSRSPSPRRRRRSRSRSRSRRYSRSRSRSPPTKYRRRKHSRSRSRSRSPYYKRSHQRSRSDRGYHRSRRSRSHSPMSTRRRHDGNRDDPEPTACLGIFGLSLYTQERELRDVFSRYGTVEQVQIVYDRQSGRSRGFSFIYFKNVEDAIEAKERCNGAEIDGRRIRVDYSITHRAHTPTPGIYLGKPTDAPHRSPSPYNKGYRRRSPSPYSSSSRRRSRSRSRSYSPRRY